jgi:cytochrome c biogenesis protein CcmG, thiol:disulfide interchange protein DsbE
LSDKARILRFLIPLAAFVLIGIVFEVGVKHSPEVGDVPSPLIGKPAPVWSLAVLDGTGRTYGSKDLLGRWYVVNVWGSWCYACRDEHQTLLSIARQSSVPIIGVDWMDDDAQATDYLTKLGNPYTTVATDHDGRFAIDWGVYMAPETFLVNPAGVVVFKQIGVMTPEAWRTDFAARLPPQLARRTS